MSKKSETKPVERRIKFLSRDLPFPTDPTFREYRVVEEITGVDAQQIMTGDAGAWMLPILAMVALMRSAGKDFDRDALDRVMDLRPQDFEITGLEGLEDESPAGESPLETPTGTESTPEIPEESGTPDSPTTSPEQPENPTT